MAIDAPRADADPPIRYIESSALVAAIIEHDAEALRLIRRRGRRVTSALTIAESNRAIVRARATGRIDAAQARAASRALARFAGRCDLVNVTDAVLQRAGRPFPVEPVRTLDAFHLATIEISGEIPASIAVVTRDVRIRDNAVALGYVVERDSLP